VKFAICLNRKKTLYFSICSEEYRKMDPIDKKSREMILETIFEEVPHGFSKFDQLKEIADVIYDILERKFEFKSTKDRIEKQVKIASAYKDYKQFLIDDNSNREESDCYFDEDVQIDDIETINEKIENYESFVNVNTDILRKHEDKLIEHYNELISLYKKHPNLVKIGTDEIQGCKICFEDYDCNHKESCIYLCGHRFGHSCLEKLEPKRCPLCNKNFVNKHITILY
jgi:rubrerythrin